MMLSLLYTPHLQHVPLVTPIPLMVSDMRTVTATVCRRRLTHWLLVRNADFPRISGDAQMQASTAHRRGRTRAR